jgi:ribose transport system substrate-binding protein
VKKLASGLSALLVIVVFASCSSSSSTTEASKPSGETSAANLAYVKSQIDAHTKLPTFSPPGPAFDTSTLKGKIVFNIPDSSANPFATNIANGEAEAAKLLGVNYINCPTQGQTRQWVQCMNEAVARKVDVVNDFGGVDPRVLLPQISAAQAAGIKVVATNVYDTKQEPVAVDHSVPVPYTQAAKLIADWVIQDTRGDANVLVLTSNEVLGTPPMVNGLKSEFAQYCGSGCKLSFVNAPVAQWATKIEPAVRSALIADPSINYIVPIYDSMSQFVLPAITATNSTGKVHVATFNGTPFVLGYMQTGDVVRMDVGQNLNWLGWGYMDADARVLAGQELAKTIDEKLPLRVFTKANVRDAGVPPQVSVGYGDAYLGGYKQLWGLE